MKIKTKADAVRRINKLYGPFALRGGDVEFDEAEVPRKLLALVPYARFWGISDDMDRERLAELAPEKVKFDLQDIIEHYDDMLDLWLAGEELQSPKPSDAYVAFSAMRMCADFM